MKIQEWEQCFLVKHQIRKEKEKKTRHDSDSESLP